MSRYNPLFSLSDIRSQMLVSEETALNCWLMSCDSSGNVGVCSVD